MENKKIIFTALIAVAIGLAAGYFIFGKKNGSEMAATGHQQSMETTATGGQEEIWTCSMHPQIRQNEPGICPICEMDLIPLESNTSSDPLVLEMTEAAVTLSNIQTTVIGRGSHASQSLVLNGKVQEDERRAASQVAHIPGRIEQLFVTFTGETVKKGQKLATIYSPELIAAQRELLEAVKLQAVNSHLPEAARNKLRFWKIPEATIQEIVSSGEVRETFTLFAETSGIVANRRVSVGDYVKQGQVLYDLTNLDRVWVLFDAYEEDLSQIRLGDKITFTTPALPGKTFTTSITFIDPVINPATRAASLRAEVGNGQGLLKPEMFVKGTILSETDRKAPLTVPRSAVMWTGSRSVVYVKMPDMEIPSFQFREVVLGEATGSGYVVKSGLDAGEEVVSNGNFVIDAAAQLNNQRSMMNRDVSIKKGEQGIPDYQAETPAAFKKQLGNLAASYLTLKDALVSTNPGSAQQAAGGFSENLEKVDMALLQGEAHLYWMEQLDGLRSHAQNIAEADEIDAQRKQFSFLSNLLIKAVTAFGTTSNQLYVQYCPMAIDNKGADWLAQEKEIRNPYFGDKMMTCGSVKRELTPRMDMENGAPSDAGPAHEH